MGAGIAEVFARNGYRVVGVELTDESLERGRAARPALHRPRREARQARRGRAGRAGRPHRLHHRDGARSRTATWWSRRSSSSSPLKQALFAPARRHRRPRHRSWPPTPPSLSVTEISTATSHPGRVVGVHFFNPAPVQKLVEIVRTVVTEPDVLDDVAALARSLGKTPVVCGDKAGFIANALLFGYLNHAVAMYEGKYATREDIDAAMRFGCGYPMGPLALLDLIGLDTAYEILDTMYKQGRDRLHAPGPDPQADGHRGHARPQDRPRLLHLRGPGQPGRRRRRAHPVGRRGPAAAPRRQAGRRGRHRHDGQRHRRGVRQGRLRRGLRRPRRGQGRQRARHHRAVAGEGDPARQARRVRARRGARPADRHHEARRPRRRRHRRRGDRRGPDGQDRAVREPRRDLQAGRDPGDHDLVAAGDLAGQGDQAPAGRRRHALLQPGADHEARRGRVARSRRRTRSRRRPARSAPRSARSRSRAATGPASSSTRCCSPTSTTRSRCSRRTTPRPTTSTPR